MQKYTFDVYHASLKKVYQLEYMAKDIMQNVIPVKHIRKTGRALTLEEQKYFLKVIAGNKLENLYKFYLLTGVRMSEALNISKNDINFKNNTIHIRGTKTSSSDRFLPIFTPLKRILESVHTKDLLFDYTANAVICNFKRLKKKYNFNFTIHSLRHTFATRCLEMGINIKIVQN